MKDLFFHQTPKVNFHLPLSIFIYKDRSLDGDHASARFCASFISKVSFTIYIIYIISKNIMFAYSNRNRTPNTYGQNGSILFETCDINIDNDDFHTMGEQ